ncbi:MAG: MoaD/ThiS family protein [Caldisphaera sp.]|jgi:molybdopterin converting factor small subunit|nr:MAG: hypothetical protein C0171_01675 [Caldisphaera sp.]
MKITVMYGGEYTRIAKTNKEELDVNDNCAIDDLLSFLKEEHGDLIIKGIANGDALLLLNGRSIKPNSKLLLKEGDFISILPPVKGGF